jgi:hypothetical protein
MKRTDFSLTVYNDHICMAAHPRFVIASDSTILLYFRTHLSNAKP